MTPEIDQAIAEAWPEKWARANSKGRNNLRRRWNYVTILNRFVADNPSALCSNCMHAGTRHTMPAGQLYCDLDSDFEGYARVAPEHVCPRHAVRSVQS